jgi:hypothetical protein
MTGSPESEAISRQLDRMIEILEDIFILQASIAQMNRKKLRAVVGIEMKRVTRISKHLKPPLEAGTLAGPAPLVRPRASSKKMVKK